MFREAPMRRLGVLGLEKLGIAQPPARLRGVVVESCDGLSADALCAAVDGAAFLTPLDGNDVELVQELLAAGRHVMLAAHPTISARRKVLTESARRSGSRLAVLNPERFLPSRRLIKQHLDAGKLGEVGLVRIHRWETD